MKNSKLVGKDLILTKVPKLGVLSIAGTIQGLLSLAGYLPLER